MYEKIARIYLVIKNEVQNNILLSVMGGLLIDLPACK